MNRTVCRNVLIVSGEAQLTRQCLQVLAARALRGTVARDWRSCEERLCSGNLDLAVIDCDAVDGMAALERIKRDWPEVPVILVNSAACVRSAVAAVRAGAEDFLTKPVDDKELAGLLDSLLPSHDVPLAAVDQQDNRCLYQIAGQSLKLLNTLKLARKVAPTSVPVLITGESGTGKELISYLVHRHSNRSRGPYIRVNCAALSESLLESELFGHERGAFTGAHAQRKGRFERAHGGTLLLDEISETGPRLQAELLRVLEQQDFERLGGSESVQVNVRIVATSNRDLSAEVEKGRFRRDLFYRINGVHLCVPPLRQRPDDIPGLVWHFVNLYAREAGRQIAELDGRMLEAFQIYHWPGNVRQLRNVVRTALVLGEGKRLSLDGAMDLLPPPSSQEHRPAAKPPTLALADLERTAIFEALRRTNRHQAKAASLLGITDRTLREKLRRYRQQGVQESMGEDECLMQHA